MAKNQSQRNLRESSIHVLRHSLHKLGKTTQEIAVMHRVSEQAVVRSIAIVDAYRLLNTTETLNSAMIATILSRQEKVGKALDNALTATVIGKEGVKVPNHEVQLKALGEVRQIVQAVQPKASGGSTKILVNQQTGVHAAATPGESRFVGFEERLREIRVKVDNHNQLPPPESVAAPLGEDELAVEQEEDVQPQHSSG